MRIVEIDERSESLEHQSPNEHVGCFVTHRVRSLMQEKKLQKKEDRDEGAEILNITWEPTDLMQNRHGRHHTNGASFLPETYGSQRTHQVECRRFLAERWLSGRKRTTRNRVGPLG